MEKIPISINLYQEKEFSFDCEEGFVNYADLGHQFIVIDSGPSVSLCGLQCPKQYLANFELVMQSVIQV